MFHRIHFLTSLALITLASTLVSPSASAASITYTASGTVSDGALAASASFVTSAGQIQITLTNTLSPSSIVAPEPRGRRRGGLGDALGEPLRPIDQMRRDVDHAASLRPHGKQAQLRLADVCALLDYVDLWQQAERAAAK